MKYGLITFKETENIGDDIQSYVAIRFLPQIDYYIEREKLDMFMPKKKEQIYTIMNGWYLHSKINFPLSPYIYPLWISTHFSAYSQGGITTEYLSQYKEQLNKYGPIGCRDTSTMKLLKENDIDHYLSGCMTLTIEADPTVQKEDYICLVDIDQEAEKCIREELPKEKIIKKTHVLDKEQNKKLSWNKRFKNVKNLLDTYQSAKLVVTSRLHCALPCLALGTPVLLLYDENKAFTKDRLSDYAKIVTHMSTSEFLKKGIKKIKTGIKNPTDYLKIRESLENRLYQEIINSKNLELSSNELPSLNNYLELYIKPKEKIDRLFETATNELKNYINLRYEKEYWKNEFDILLKKADLENNYKQKIELENLIISYTELSKENASLKKRLEKYEKEKR